MNTSEILEDGSNTEGRSDDMESIESVNECDYININSAERKSEVDTEDDDHIDEIGLMDTTSPNSDGITGTKERSDGLTPCMSEQHEEDSDDDDAVSRNLSGLNEGDDDEEDSEHQACLAGSLPALRTYFYERLVQVILFLGGSAELMQGWRASVVKKEGGLTMGQLEIEYVTNGGRRFRSRVEVACFLGLMPSIKNIRSMTRDQLYINAIETRERLLISQHLAAADYTCDEVQFEDDVVTLLRDGLSCSGTGEKFAFGNLTVLSWGHILPENPAFHSSSQIYPLGFRCLRQEHDLALDRVVDCLCEIDGSFETQPQTTVGAAATTTAGEEDNRAKVLVPVFRITVAWELPEGGLVKRVYEARSAQQAWQCAMLEQLGTASAGDEGERGALQSVENEASDGVNSTAVSSGEVSAFQQPDEEELSMRAEIRDLKRNYFRALRVEQSLGLQAAIQSRFAIEQFDSFGEELVLRMIEGMEGSFACRSYAFLDSRSGDHETGKKSLLKAHSKMFAKAKVLDKVIHKSGGTHPEYIAASTDGGPLGAPIHRKRKVDEVDGTRTAPGIKMTRVKGDDKELRALTANFLKIRGARVREIEKGITVLKAAMVRNVKKRRDDARVVVEALCDKETASALTASESSTEMDVKAASTAALTPAELNRLASNPRGPAQSAPVYLDGAVTGQMLELHECLRTFHSALHLPVEKVPSVSVLLGAARACDPAYRAVRTYTRGLEHSFEYVAHQDYVNGSHALADVSLPEAMSVLNRVGVTLCQPLLQEYERMYGLDQAAATTGDVRIPVNELTWREIAHSALLANACRDLGETDLDTAIMLKGRGFYTTPESADRKALKLARRRIAFNYTIRDEFQESLYGFSAGQCLRLPAPADPFHSAQVVWTVLLGALARVPGHQGWLIYEVIKAAAISACAVDTSVAARRLKKALQECLHPSLLKIDDGSAAKHAALSVLSSQFNRGGSSNKPAPEATEDRNSITASLYNKVRLVYSFAPDMAPLCAMDLWEKQARESVRRAAQIAIAAPSTACSSAGGNVDSQLQERMDTDGDAAEVDACDVSMEVANAAELVDTNSSSSAPTSQQSIKSKASKGDVDAEGEGSDNDGEDEDEEQLEVEHDAEQAMLLSVCMQRCYLVLRDLMNSSHAHLFLQPVDMAQLPAHHKYASQPLSLTEIRAHLVGGGYADSLMAFYCDLNLLIENALAFNAELSPARIAAHKLQFLFERLFFETVLCWDNPLPFHDSCHACRTAETLRRSEKVAVCDRCSACYHLACLDPPMSTAPRSEWYCIPCVEQRTIANAHPYKTAEVVHPADPEATGEVVGIEQTHETIMFVVQFGTLREMWNSKKVRQHAIMPEEEAEEGGDEMKSVTMDVSTSSDQAAPLIDNGKENDGTVVARSSSVAAETTPTPKASKPRAHLEIVMPSGYDIEDYDRVCGMARAYTGWGASHYLAPPLLLDAHSLAAKERAELDPLFDTHRKAVAALCASPSVIASQYLGNEEYTAFTGMQDWAVILRSLMQRALESPVLTEALAVAEDDLLDEQAASKIMEGLQSGKCTLEMLQTLLKDDACSRKKRGTTLTLLIANGAKNKLNGAGAGAADDDEESEDELLFPPKKVPAVAATNTSRNRRQANLVVDDDEEAEFDEPMSSKVVVEDNGSDDDASSCSESDDELEFFDVQGRCLTSGGDNTDANATRSKSIKRSNGTVVCEDAEAWQVRQISRQKGREDALLTQELVQDVLLDLDVDGKAEAAEDKEDMVRVRDSLNKSGATFYRSAMTAVVKACMGRPSESLVIDDWLLGWQHKMQVLMQTDKQEAADHDESASDSPQLCELCGYEESFLGSPFVYAQSAEEYKAYAASVDNDSLREANASDDLGAQADILLGLQSTAGGVFTSTGIKGFRARSRANKGVVWLPVDAADAQTETRECRAINRSLLSGSVIAHECCADFIHFSRQQSQGRHHNADNAKAVEILMGLGRGKTTSLGTDRLGHHYWVFLSSPDTLYISGASGGQTSAVDSKSSIAAMPESTRSTAWWQYTGATEIAHILHWLDPRVQTEKALKRLISILFPGASEAVLTMPPPAVTMHMEVNEEDRASSSASSTTALENSLIDQAVIGAGADDCQQAVTVPVVEDAFAADGDDSSEGESEGDSQDGSDDDEEDAEKPAEEKEVPKAEPLIAQQRAKRGRPFGSVNKTNSATSLLSLAPIPTPAPPSTSLFKKSELVLVRSRRSGILWDARILDTRTGGANGQMFYKVHFQQWNSSYEGWYDASCILSARDAVTLSNGAGARTLVAQSRSEHLRINVLEPPAVLQSLHAYQMIEEPDRAGGPLRPPLSYSDSSSSPVAMLRTALLMIEAALPLGAVDDAEDRWGDDFVIAWRQAVCASGDATALMQCQIMLEYGIRTAWLKPTGLKVLSCLPSRAMCLRNATCGMVAVRVWVLDQTIRYDKTLPPPGSSTSKSAAGGKKSGGGGALDNRGRPTNPKPTEIVHPNKSGRTKARKSS